MITLSTNLCFDTHYVFRSFGGIALVPARKYFTVGAYTVSATVLSCLRLHHRHAPTLAIRARNSPRRIMT